MIFLKNERHDTTDDVIDQELDRPVETIGDAAVRLCEMLSCENCPVVIHNCDNRTDYEKKVDQASCCMELKKWIISESRNESSKDKI